MVRCAVLECPNKQGKCSGITFHKFPKDEVRRQQWIQAVGRNRWTPTTSSVVCSSHFTEANMDRTSLMYVRLRQEAVPTVFESLPKQLKKKIQCATNKSRQNEKQDESRQECHQNQPAEADQGDPNLEETLIPVCGSQTREPTVGSALLTTLKQEGEAGDQIPVTVVLEWSEVGTCETQQGSPLLPTNMEENNEVEQKPFLANLMEWHNVKVGAGSPGLTMSSTSTANTPQVQTVMCTPDTSCEINLKRKFNKRIAKTAKRKKKISNPKITQHEIEGEWEHENQDEVGARESTPEALLLECCAEEDTCDSEPVSPKTSRCASPQEVLALCTIDNPSTELLKKHLCQSTEQLRISKKKIKMLMQNRRRFQKRITSLKATCSELKSKNLLNEDKIKFLEKTLGGSYRELFERKSSNTNAGLPLNYSTQLREFASKLYFYSRDAYHYMRQTFQNCLPHPGTLRRWNNPCANSPTEFTLSDEMSSESVTLANMNGEAVSILEKKNSS